MLTILQLPFIKDRTRRLNLEFVERPVPLRQGRVLGRQLMQPVVPLKDYRCEAVIDWVEMEFHLVGASQFRYVQGELKPLS